MSDPNGARDGAPVWQPDITGAGRVQQGTPGNDVIDADSGFNHVVVDAGAGNDTVTTGNWNVVVNGGAGNDTIISGNAGDFFNGGEGDDRLVARNQGNDPAQIDTLKGENGNDTLVNEDAYAYMEGGNGRDTYIIHKDALGTTIKDFRPREGEVIRIEGLTPALAQQLAGGDFREVCDRHNLRVERVNPRDVQMQVTTDSSNSATLEIRGRTS